jgi:RNA polymerase sigma-70 factor (ECF subfamily)
VTVNAALAHRRRQARRPERHLHVSLDCIATHAGSGGCAPDHQAQDHELRQHLERAIARLPEMYRDVFVLADVEGLPNAKIGQLLGLSLAAVKSRLHRARLTVRDALAPFMGGSWLEPVKSEVSRVADLGLRRSPGCFAVAPRAPRDSADACL